MFQTKKYKRFGTCSTLQSSGKGGCHENMYRRFSFRSLDGTGRFALVGIPYLDYHNGHGRLGCDWRAAVIEFLCKLAHLIILIRRILK
jgi:hypothetical protein